MGQDHWHLATLIALMLPPFTSLGTANTLQHCLEESRACRQSGNAFEAQARLHQAIDMVKEDASIRCAFENMACLIEEAKAQGDTHAALQVVGIRRRRLQELAGIPTDGDDSARTIGLKFVRVARCESSSVYREAMLQDALRLLTRAPTDPEVQAAQGQALLELGRPDAAWSLLASAIRARPNETETRLALARISLQRHRYDQALRLLAPRPRARARRFEPVVMQLTRALAAVGRTTDAHQFVESWYNLWHAEGQTPRNPVPLLESRLELARAAGKRDSEFALLCALVRAGSHRLSSNLVQVAGHMAIDPANRHAVFASLAMLPVEAFSGGNGLLTTFAKVAMGEDAPEPFVSALERQESQDLQPLEPDLHTLHGRLERTSRQDLAERVARLLDAAQPADTFAVTEDRAHPADAQAGEVILRLGHERCAVNSRTRAIVGAPPTSPILKYVAGVCAATIGEYPEGLVERLHLLRITVKLTRLGSQHNAIGLARLDLPSIDVLWDGQRSNEEWRFMLHHELGHQIDGRVSPEEDREWTSLNPPEFRYTQNYDVFAPMILTETASQSPGILNAYAASAVTEDKAVVWSEMMSHPRELAARAAQDPVLASKIALWRARAARFLPAFTPGFFDAQRPPVTGNSLDLVPGQK